MSSGKFELQEPLEPAGPLVTYVAFLAADREVPAAVIEDHYAYHGRVLGIRGVEVVTSVAADAPRAHPFDGPEVFDDYAPPGEVPPNLEFLSGVVRDLMAD